MAPIPRLAWDDPAALELMQRRQPVILTGTRLAGCAQQKWDLNYLRAHVDPAAMFSVYNSANGRFMYSNVNKNEPGFAFTPTVYHEELRFATFVERLVQAEAAESPRVYLQQPLYQGIGDRITDDFKTVPWEWVNTVQQALGFGHLTTNLLLIGQPGTVTPCHYDEQHNLLAVCRGQKKCTLFSPDQFECLYPYPVGHPADRQSQVNFDEPDDRRFPRFAEARGEVCTVAAGDVLYIPPCWWHMVENVAHDGFNLAITFWFKCGPGDAPAKKARGSGVLVSVRRNLEKMAAQELGPRTAIRFWKATMDSNGQGLVESSFRDYHAVLLKRVQLLLPKPEGAAVFLQGLVAGRFYPSLCEESSTTS